MEINIKRKGLCYFLSIVFVVLFSSLLLSSGVLAADSVTVSVEKFTLGQGYIVEPTNITLQAGDNAATVLSRALRQNSVAMSHSGGLNDGFYLQSLTDPTASDSLQVPAYIVTEMASKLPNLDGRFKGGELGEFDFTYMSGWMYSVNNVCLNYGADKCKLKDGDVMRWQYSLYGYGADLGFTLMTANPYITPPNKDALTQAVAAANSRGAGDSARLSRAYKNAVTVLQEMTATEEQVSQALSDLQAYLNSGVDAAALVTSAMPVISLAANADLTPYAPEEPVIAVQKVTLNQSELYVAVGDSAKLTAAIEPKNASDQALVWASDNQAVATVDTQGQVTAVQEGKANIVVTAAGGKRSSCSVTVLPQGTSTAVSGVALDKTSLDLQVGKSETLVATVAPVYAANKAVTWSSNNLSVATVSETGAVRAVAPGVAIITVTTEEGKKTMNCTVVVTPAATPAPTTPPVAKMSDVLKGAWYYDYVSYVLSKGIMKGTSDTTFDPNSPVTRGQFVTILGRWAGIKDSTASSPTVTKFKDVKSDKYYAAHVAWAVDKGITLGTSAATFAPEDNISRQDMATLIARCAAVMSIDLPAGDGQLFADDREIRSYAKEAVYSMKAAGILEGKGDNKFAPQANATRAESAKIFQMLQNF